MPTRIVYSAPLRPGQTSLSRLDALRDLGHDVIPVNVAAYFQAVPRFVRSIEYRTYLGPAMLRYNLALRHIVEVSKPDVIWIDKGVWLYPRTLASLKRNGSLLVHYNTDDILCNRHPHFLLRRGLSLYDLHLTTNASNVSDLQLLGAARVRRTAVGYDHRVFYRQSFNTTELASYRADAVFIGHWEETTEQAVLAIIAAGINLRVWGENWHKAKAKDRLRGHVTYRALWLEEYVKALHGTKVALCFLSKWNRNTAAGRSFEIPACGAFLLAERTDEHLQCYEEGREAEFFGSLPELIDKLHHYIHSDADRSRIADRGHERCMRSGYSYSERVKHDWRHVEDLRNRVA